MSTTKNILVVGITHPSENAPIELKQHGGSPEKLKQAVGEIMKAAGEAGYSFTVRQLSPEDPSPVVDDVKALLKEKSWDGYLVGFGVRGDPSLTAVFEDLINAGREIRPETRMGFNTNPLDLLETAKRIC